MSQLYHEMDEPFKLYPSFYRYILIFSCAGELRVREKKEPGVKGMTCARDAGFTTEIDCRLRTCS